MASIKAQKIRYDESGRIISGSAAIIDTIYVSTGQKYLLHNVTTENCRA